MQLPIFNYHNAGNTFGTPRKAHNNKKLKVSPYQVPDRESHVAPPKQEQNVAKGGPRANRTPKKLENEDRYRNTRRDRQISQKLGERVAGYSAGDSPEKRKNPELYAGIKDVNLPSLEGLSQVDAPASDSHRSASAQTPATSPVEAPAVRYMVSPVVHEALHSRSGQESSATRSSSASAAAAAAAAMTAPVRQRAAAGRGSSSGGAPLSLAQKPEVLAPVGGWPQLRAAVENGADAVYFGLEDFNARARAANFSVTELPDVMSYLHARGVKGFVTLNVLVFDEELSAVEEQIRAMAMAGVDAVIVQDWGVVELMRRVAPGLPVHGSTQMSVTSAEGAAWVSELGVERVVVARELSVREIAKVCNGVSGTEVEAFVHGALCVSYSGQCFSSEAWGGRSANRGQCAQACRLPYGLLVDGVLRELGDVKYLLSPQDLMAVEQVPELILAGVSCFKIEGRLKGPEYVALTTGVYRKAVDAAWDALTAAPAPGSSGEEEAAAHAAARAVVLTERERWDLEQVFARGQDGDHRGLTPGFLEGVRHQRLVRGRAPRHRGVYLGRVEAVSAKGVVLKLEAPLKRGDGVAFDAGRPEEDEPGGVVYDILDAKGTAAAIGSSWATNEPVSPGARVTMVLGQSSPAQAALILRRVAAGDLVWRTKDPALESRLRASFEGLAAADTRCLPVTAAVAGALGQPLTLAVTDPDNRTAIAATRLPLAAAVNRPMTADDVSRALGPQLGEPTLVLEGQLDTTGLDLSAGGGGYGFVHMGEKRTFMLPDMSGLGASPGSPIPVLRTAPRRTFIITCSSVQLALSAIRAARSPPLQGRRAFSNRGLFRYPSAVPSFLRPGGRRLGAENTTKGPGHEPPPRGKGTAVGRWRRCAHVCTHTHARVFVRGPHRPGPRAGRRAPGCASWAGKHHRPRAKAGGTLTQRTHCLCSYSWCFYGTSHVSVGPGWVLFSFTIPTPFVVLMIL
ncbi:hypothetical protein Vretifemale_19091 [Volvox reticuliferus]|uniref:Peptidase U32 collagenase domain-containing protein n=1 Tax=Volvox reticuliferus TaxID=1737510 RepID=A0A8J4D0W2_9CHLO|nr:hypothetical protein Vretifemale_19091 [Volvox reticuliferus]